MKEVRVVRVRQEGMREPETWVNTFLCSETMTEADVEAAMRAAVEEYLATDEGKAEAENTVYDFNWGDAMMFVPDSTWKKHGIIPSDSANSIEITFKQDEVLCKEPYEDDE